MIPAAQEMCHFLEEEEKFCNSNGNFVHNHSNNKKHQDDKMQNIKKNKIYLFLRKKMNFLVRIKMFYFLYLQYPTEGMIID